MLRQAVTAPLIQDCDALQIAKEKPGVTDVATFRRDGQDYIAVAESLSMDVRFGTDTRIYRFNAN